MGSDSEFSQEKPIAQNTDGESDAQTRQTQPDVPIAPSVPPTPPAKPHYEITCKTEKTLWDKFKDGVEIVGICLLAVYTWYSIKMYCANKKAANAAQSAANTAASALHIDQRAWLSAWISNDPYSEQELMHLTVHIRNSGHTFAKNSTINRNVAVVSKGTEPQSDDWKNDLTVTAGLIPPGIGETWTHEIRSSEKLNKTLVDALRDGAKIVYVKGRIDFDDIFPDSHRHWVSFCFHSSGGTNWLTCKSGNDIDQY